MLLVDSLYINNGGGKVLLDYLVEEIEGRGLDVFYLFDERCKNDYQWVSEDRKTYIKASLLNRYRFYKRNGDRFSKIFCFGNIPPLTKQNGEVITYFHQLLYLESPFDLYVKNKFSLKKYVRLAVRKQILKQLTRNSDMWFLQLGVLADPFINQYGVGKDQIKILPFYPPIAPDGNHYHRMDDTYLYVSGGSSHKNHSRLINAFCKFNDRFKKGLLTLTVPSNFEDVCELINKKIAMGYPINNIGFVERKSLYKIYQKHKYLIFPSLAESFGLGIVEAIKGGCKVIGANLDYMHDVCIPSITFDPYNEDDIFEALIISLDKDINDTVIKAANEIDYIIDILRSGGHTRL